MKTALLVVALLGLAGDAAAKEPTEKAPFLRDGPGTLRPEPQGLGRGLRIYNGNIATRKQFPYQVGYFLDLANFCGGSLIHPKWVLTTANCLQGSKAWTVYLGVSSMNAAKQEGRLVVVSTWGRMHEDYNPYEYSSDIGVIQLPREVPLSDYVKTINLAPASANYAGKVATVSGFGKVDEIGWPVISPLLRYASMKVLNNHDCTEFYGSADYTQICLDASAGSACASDWGGPVVVGDVQIGLISYGCKNGCSKPCPIGATRLNVFYDWLSEATGVNFPI